MAEVATTVRVFFGESALAGSSFILDDPTQGVLDSVTYTLGGDSGTDVTGDVTSVTVDRGRESQIFKEIDAGLASVILNNEDRAYDPMHSAGPHFGNIKPGRHVEIETAGVLIYSGRVADWNFDYETSLRSVVVMECEDALATLGRQEFDEWTATASQTAGPRLTDVLNRSEVAWSGGARDLDAGVSVLQGDVVSWGSNVLNYCQLVAQSDLGSFFASRDGLVAFRDRHHNLGGTASVAFGGSGVPFVGVAVSFGSETLYTRVSVDREGGTAQSVINADAADEYGVRSLSLSGLLQNSDSQALDMATYLSQIYGSGDLRISEVAVQLWDDRVSTETAVQILSLDLTDLVSVEFTPNGVGLATTQTCIVEGIRHEVTPRSHVVRLSLGKFDERSPFILDDAVLGLLDGTSVLTF